MSEAHRRDRIKTLLEEALLQAPLGRKAWLARVAPNEPEVRDEVLALIGAHERAAGFLADPTIDTPPEVPPPPPADFEAPQPPWAEASDPGTSIGRYRLLQLIGEGGFGSVYLAEQRDPVTRKVALKVIKLGMDTRKVIARFEAERQALALMEHPNIAKVLDAGATDTGRPYFVMELVRGVPITQYCDENRLPIAARLDLFRQVCSAIQHAHAKGVIHRDIKPSNVLVTLHDGKPLPKVIDFGIAKATSARLTEKTLFTEFRQLIGTPEYMSPEQADINAADIDTRADVYSLGVLLYELLTGATPFDGRRLRSAAFNELQRIIREEEPPRPSTRLSSLETLPSVAANRALEPRRLTTHLRGDLDWIVMKCLEKDRTRRYETPGALAEDLVRHISNEPVVAGPPTTSYRFGKFVRRHRTPVITSAIILAALVTGVITTTLAMIHAHRAERRQAELVDMATEQLKQLSARLKQASVSASGETGGIALGLADPGNPDDPTRQIRALGEFGNSAVDNLVASHHRIESERDKAERVSVFMEQTLGAVGPSVAAGRDTTMLHDLMDAAAARIASGELKDSPEAELRLRLVIGDVNREIGAYAQAESMLRAAVELSRRLQPGDSQLTARALSALGMACGDQKKLNEAESFTREAIDMARRLHGEDNIDAATGLISLGSVLHDMRRLDESEAASRQGMAILERLGRPDDPDVAEGWRNLAAIRLDRDEPDAAEPMYNAAMAILRKNFPGDHPRMALCHHSLGMLAYKKHDFDAAEAGFRASLEMNRRLYKGDHLMIANDLESLAGVERARGDSPATIALLIEALGMRRRLLGGESIDTAQGLCNLGTIQFESGDLEQAETNLRDALAMYQRLRPPMHTDLLLPANALSIVLSARHKYAEAVDVLNQKLAVQRHSTPNDAMGLSRTLAQLGTALLACNRPADAETALRECLSLRRAIAAATSSPAASRPAAGAQAPWQVPNTMSMLGGALVAQAHVDPPLAPEQRIAKLRESESLLLDAWNAMKDDPAVPRGGNPKLPNGGDDRAREALARIVDLYAAWQAVQPSDEHAAEQARQWQAALAKYDAAKPPAPATQPRPQ